MNERRIVLASPFLIIAVNLGVALLFGQMLGKWAFAPMILIGWVLWLFFIMKFGKAESIKKWLARPTGGIGWTLLAIITGLVPLPLFIFHYNTLSDWKVFIPWIILALINPWIEEFYWRGLLLDFTKNWSHWTSVLYSGFLFSINHAAFGINSKLNNGLEVVLSTLFMGVVWGFVYKKTKSLRWTIFAHFLVDFLGLSVSAFLDLWEKGMR
jgi:membrane protease YdiL (CAAX protease family)